MHEQDSNSVVDRACPPLNVNALQQPLILLVAAVLLGVAGFALGLRLGRRPAAVPAARKREEQTQAPAVDERASLRASALDSLADAVLIAERDGRIRDCNASALTLFGRHRGELEDQYATSLRRFDGLDQAEPYRAASERSVWIGEGWVRQPDGGMKLCQVRVIAIRDARARIVAFAESFRDVAQDRDIEQEVRDLLYGVRAVDSSSTSDDPLTAREDLRVLSEGFRDLDHMLRQYERLLPSLGADDPLAESIAGQVSDVRATASAVGVQALLQEIPRALARLRFHLQREAEQSATPDSILATSPERTPPT